MVGFAAFVVFYESVVRYEDGTKHHFSQREAAGHLESTLLGGKNFLIDPGPSPTVGISWTLCFERAHSIATTP